MLKKNPNNISFKLVWPGEPEQQLVFALRYKVYVEEFGLPIQNEEKLMYDKYDQIFPSVIFYYNNVPAGSIRVELAALGTMEIQEANEYWENNVNWDNSVSFCRLVILKEYRGKGITSKIWPFLFNGPIAANPACQRGFFATNNKKLIRRYKLFGTIIDNSPRDYNFMNLPRSRYILFSVPLGKDGSLLRKAIVTYFKTVEFIETLIYRK